jgi:hypothetical protein
MSFSASGLGLGAVLSRTATRDYPSGGCSFCSAGREECNYLSRSGVIQARVSFGAEPLHRDSYNGHLETNMHDLLVSREVLLGKHETLHTHCGPKSLLPFPPVPYVFRGQLPIQYQTTNTRCITLPVNTTSLVWSEHCPSGPSPQPTRPNPFIVYTIHLHLVSRANTGDISELSTTARETAVDKGSSCQRCNPYPALSRTLLAIVEMPITGPISRPPFRAL